MKHQNILDTIGNTPLVKLNKINKNKNIEIWLKLEGYNPSGSIKDRIVLNMIRKAESEGKLDKTKTLLDATSGNTGISLSLIGNLLGYKVTIVMQEDSSSERKALIKFLGTNLILTPSELGEMGARKKAQSLYRENKDKFFFVDQFGNENNPEAHYKTTAKEIYNDLPDLTDLVVATGTGGTYEGLRQAFNKYNSSVRITAVQPGTSQKIDGLVNFVDEEIPDLFKDSSANIRYVDKIKAIKMTKMLALLEGILSGISTGSTLWTALQISSTLKSGKIVVISADRIDRYYSTDLFTS